MSVVERIPASCGAQRDFSVVPFADTGDIVFLKTVFYMRKAE